MKITLILFALSFSNLSYGFKVLGILPMASKSHYAIGSSIVESLYDVGHEVTVITPYPSNKLKKNYREVSVAEIVTKLEADEEAMPNPFNFGKLPAALLLFMLYNFGAVGVEMLMENEGVKNLMDSGEKFDVCILEVFNIDAAMGLADHFDCELISFTTFGALRWIDDMTGNESPSSYVPIPFLSYTDSMSFTQRLWNTALGIIENVAFNLYHIPRQKRLYKKYFPNAKRSFDDMFKSSAIIFLNNHVSSSFPRPYLPNMIDICGVHVKEAKKLPDDIQNFLDSATDGAIVFSMGSFIKSKEFPELKREAFVKAFGKLKQKVIWKYENETLPNKPDNVMISSWMPQRDILAHKNMKLFMTHGGLLGTTEAVVEGVAVLGFPIFGDQRMNMMKASSRGYGLYINYDDIEEEILTSTLKELIENPKYQENAKEISSRFNDRPMTARESVVYWTEFAFRHKGAAHLRAESRNFNFIEFNLIDVYLTLVIIVILILFINFFILKSLFKKIFCRKSTPKKKRN